MNQVPWDPVHGPGPWDLVPWDPWDLVPWEPRDLVPWDPWDLDPGDPWDPSLQYPRILQNMLQNAILEQDERNASGTQTDATPRGTQCTSKTSVAHP